MTWVGVQACKAISVEAERATAPVASGRLVILGFDGVDPRRVADLIAQGKLPHMKALAEAGYLGPLATTNPPQSPVAWAAFATGLPPGEHGIFDFVARDAVAYIPMIATTRVRAAEVVAGAFRAAAAENLRRGDAFWDVLARAGVSVRTLHVPYAYPPPGDGARALTGLGTPDVRGTNSTYTLLTTDAAKAQEKAPAGGQVVPLERLPQGGWRAELAGPTLIVDGARQTLRLPVTVEFGPAAEGVYSVTINIGSVRQTLGRGATGAYIALRFSHGHASVAATTRVTVRSIEPPELYIEPLSIDPTQPYLPVSSPPALAQAVWQKLGAHKTVGWVDDTSALGNGAMDEAQFVAEALSTMEREGALTVDALKSREDRLLVSVFTSPDRISHMFYRYIDSQHTAPKPAAERWSVAIDDAYAKMDEIVGRVRVLLDAQDSLLLMSDHGFGSFRRGFNMNRWLVQEGYLALRPGVAAPRDFFQDVDWAKTRAYALGTGGIFLNVAGRERQGIVAPQVAAALAKEIAAKIVSVRDRGVAVVRGAYLGDEIYSGSSRAAAPDVRVSLADGYRASWSTSLGGVADTLFEDNTRKWSGDHASARPEEMPGILASNRPLLVGDPRIEDLAATAYAYAGVTPPPGTIGRNLLEVQHGTGR